MLSANDKPHIGIFTRAIDQGTSGSGSHLRQILAEVLKQNESFKITLIHYKRNRNEIYSQADELIIPRNPILASLILRRHKFDILQFAPLTIFSPIWFSKARHIAIIHGIEINLVPHLYTRIEVLHQKYIHPWYARRMDRIFTVSEASKSSLARLHGIPAQHIKITTNGIGQQFRVLADKKHLRRIVAEKYAIGGPFIFHISKYSLRKNPEAIFRAFEIVIKAQPEMQLVIAGQGWSPEIAATFIDSEQALRHIQYPGFIDQAELATFLNLAEVFIFPSHAEGFGMPNLEAMACGCPVITSNSFAIPEVVGDAAIILKNNEDPEELSSYIMKVIMDEDLRHKLIGKGLERVKSFSWEKSAAVALKTYAELLTEQDTST